MKAYIIYVPFLEHYWRIIQHQYSFRWRPIYNADRSIDETHVYQEKMIPRYLCSDAVSTS